MANFTPSEIITHLTTAQTLDNARAAGERFKLPATLRTDVDADLADLMAKEVATTPAEGGRAGASAARRAALDQLRREHDGGYRFIRGLDEASITPGQRLQVFISYGWAGGEIGDFIDDRIISLARLAPTVSATEAGNAAWLYPAARLTRIAAQLAIVDAREAQATGGDSQTATLQRNAARDLAATTLLRVRFFYCSATRDADQTPELVKIGYQPRRDPGEVSGGGGETPEPPASPQNVGLTPGAVDSGELGVTCEVPEGATGLKIWREVFGNPPTLLATLTDVTALPHVLTFTPGENVSVFMTATNAGGESEPSTTVSQTAP